MNKLLTISILLFAIACGNIDNSKLDPSLLPESTGKYGEVLVVVDTLYENRSSGEQLRKIFNKAMPGLPQEETMFRMSTVAPESFKSILKRSRNLLKLNVGKGRKTDIAIERNIWAKNQLMIQITAESDEVAARILKKNRQTIRDYFNQEEIDRLHKQFAKKPEKDLIEEIKENYGLSLLIPPGFLMMQNTEEGFWIKKEKRLGEHQIIQGISYYSEPYTGDSLFNKESIYESRNRFTKKNMEGSRDSSFMVVYEPYPAKITEQNFKGNYAKTYRGLWNMENDFMGGPFFHFVTVDTVSNQLLHLDGFVYAPKFNKREYVRELEAIIKTLKLSN